MRRSPLAYPLNRSVDHDIGGAADLQTDVMRFMAILALCLVAIFALVQSIPMTPVPPSEPAPQPAPVQQVTPEAPAAIEDQRQDSLRIPPAATAPPTATHPVATRPAEQTEMAAAVSVLPVEADVRTTPMTAEDAGFTLRFASDAALMRAVAASHVGLYAIAGQRAKRMTVSASRISFWDASTPAAFHEMEAATVPASVAAALERSGESPRDVSWGVTLPGRLRTQLDALMQQHTGGTLIISADGQIHREAP